MIFTLGLEAAIGAVISTLANPVVAAALTAGSVGLGVYQATQANANANEQKKIANRRAALEQAADDAKYRQERSLINRRLAMQVDAARVAAGAGGVGGGASALVLESAYARQADADLAAASANRLRRGEVINANLANEFNRADAMQQNVAAAAISGAAQGISMYGSLTRMGGGGGAATGGGETAPANVAGGNNNWAGGNTPGTYRSPFA